LEPDIDELRARGIDLRRRNDHGPAPLLVLLLLRRALRLRDGREDAAEIGMAEVAASRHDVDRVREKDLSGGHVFRERSLEELLDDPVLAEDESAALHEVLELLDLRSGERRGEGDVLVTVRALVEAVLLVSAGDARRADAEL